jgi:tetratricopeptide (TPR) repeat protein
MMFDRRGWAAISLFTAIVALDGVAFAQQVPPQNARDEEARSLFEAGRLALEDGRFEDAYEYFERGYALSHRPPLLYNMGVAADRLHRYDDALRAFRTYLETGGDQITNRPEVQRRIQILEAAVAQGGDAPPAERGDSTGSAGGGGGFPIIASFVVGGVALVAGGLAIGFWVAANDQYGSLDASCGVRGCTDQEIADSGVETSLVLTNVFLVSSLVLLAATGATIGIEIALAGNGGSEEPTASLRIGPGALTLAGTFR